MNATRIKVVSTKTRPSRLRPLRVGAHGRGWGEGGGGGVAMSSIGRLNFPAVWGGGGGGLWWPLVTRGYSSRLIVVSRGLIGGADTPGKGGWGVGTWEFIPILTQNVGLLWGRNCSWGKGGGGGAWGD